MMGLQRTTIFLIIVMLGTFAEGLRILVFFPVPSKSHSILGHGVVNRLLEAGHEVVHVTSFPRDKPQSRLKEIDVSIVGERFRKQSEKFDYFKLKNLIGKGNIGNDLHFLYFTYESHKQVFQEQVLTDFLSDPRQNFDAVILEWFFSDIVAGIASLYQCPYIWFASTEAHWRVLKNVDEIPNPSYNVDIFSDNRPPLTFWERTAELLTITKTYLINSVVVAFEKSLYNTVFLPLAAKRGIAMPSYDESIYNASMLLINSHPSIGTPFRLPQNAKYIAGYHIDANISPLPKDLQKIMDGAEHGVIYFSMGSNLKSADMSTAMRDSLLKKFGELKQVVIWKFEEDIPNTPGNVHLVKWAPQLGILSHPNLKIFITHGGQLSTTEAIYFSVPVIGVPVVGDQHVNMRSVVDKGFGISITIAEDMAPKLQGAIQEILVNRTYKEKAKQISVMFHERAVPPGAELVYWVEHVVKTGGAKYLRSPAFDVPFYQKLYLDLVFTLLVTLYLIKVTIKTLRNLNDQFKSLKEKTN